MNVIGKGVVVGGQVPFIRLLLPCISGVLLGSLLSPDVLVGDLLHGGVWLLTLTGFFCFRHPKWFSLVFPLFLFVFCWKRTWEHHPVIDQKHFSRIETVALLGYLKEEPQIKERTIRTMFAVTGGILPDRKTVVPLQGNLLLTLERIDTSHIDSLLDTGQLGYGTKLIIDALFTDVDPPRNPGEMDYSSHLAKKNCWHRAYIRKDKVRLIGQGGGNQLLTYSIDLRKRMVEKFGRHIPDKEALAVASTLILGYRADLNRELMETYSVTGTIHVLSVSGMHVVIVFWLLAKLLYWMDWSSTLKKIRFPLLVLSLAFYALLTGLSPSVLRAALMLGFVLWAKAWKRRANTYNSIAASAFLLVMYQPKLLLDIGFQLSYLAVVSIVGLYPLLREWLAVRWRLWRAVTDYAAMSVAAQAGAFPLAMYYFQQFPLYFLPANLLIVIPASLIMYLGFALLLLPETGFTFFIAGFLGQLLSRLIVWMNHTLVWIQSLPGPDIRGIEISVFQCMLLYVIMLSLSIACLIRSKSHFVYFLILMFVLSVSWMNSFFDRWQNRKLVIHQMRSDLAISIVGRGKATVYSNLPYLEHPSLAFSILPFLRNFASPSAIYLVQQKDDEYSDGQLYFGHGLIQVGTNRVYVYQEGSGQDAGSEGFQVDILLVRGNPGRPPERVLGLFPCRILVLDGSNHDDTIEKFAEKSWKLGVETYILKNNYAYVWLLDKER